MIPSVGLFRDNRHWHHCIFTDESRFKLYHADGRAWVHRRQGERHIDLFVHGTYGNAGPSVIIWAGFHDGWMNRQVYKCVLQQILLPWTLAPFQLIQDNAPPDTARATGYFLGNQDVELMDSGSKSPDMNPIENLWWFIYVTWIILQLRQQNYVWLCSRPGRSVRLNTVIGSMPRRVRGVLTAPEQRPHCTRTAHTQKQYHEMWWLPHQCQTLHNSYVCIFISQGWGLLSQFPPFRYFPNFSSSPKYMLAVVYHVHIWQVLPQLSCGDTCQIWMWFEESSMYFCKIENFAYGEINERSFNNPHPWTIQWKPFECQSSLHIAMVISRYVLYKIP